MVAEDTGRTGAPVPAAPTPDTTQRMPRDMAAMIGTIARHRGLSAAEYFDRYWRETVTAEFKRVVVEMTGGEA